MTVITLTAAVLFGLAVMLWSRPAARRLGRTYRHGPSAARELDPALAVSAAEPRRRSLPGVTWSAAALAGLATAVLIGGTPGLLAGAAVAVATAHLLGRLEPGTVRRRRLALIADLPLAAELLAACLRAGHPPDRALQVIAGSLDGPLGTELGVVAASLRLGAEPRFAWARLETEPALAGLGRAMVRSADSGAPLAELLDGIARDARRTARFEAERRARAVGVKAALPLGLCFLPAFIVVGIVPVVAGALETLLR